MPDTRSLSAEAPRFDVDFRRLSISDANGLELDQVPPRALYTVACSLQSLLVDLSKHTHGLEARCLEHSHDARVSRLQFEEQEHELHRLAGHVCKDVNVSSPATFGPGQYLPAARATMYGRCLRSAAVSARAVRGMGRRRVGRSTAETHTGCRSPNSREGWQTRIENSN